MLIELIKSRHKIMKTKPFLVILFIFFLSCHKDNNPNVILNGTLTDCPANFSCTYNYYDYADFTNIKLPVQGKYRIFWYNSMNASGCGAMIRFYFKIPLNSSSFEIGSSQIAEGPIVAQDFDCLCCGRAVPLTEPIGGEIKGKRIDATRWLVNASIVFGLPLNKAAVDTLVVNQYFTLEKLP